MLSPVLNQGPPFAQSLFQICANNLWVYGRNAAVLVAMR